jgi:hypothetical protein
MSVSVAAAALLAAIALGLEPAPGAGAEPAKGGPPPRLQVSDNGRYLVAADGKPVFLLADTAWGLSRRLTREDAASYLETRREQGFNAVAFVAIEGGGDIAEGPSDVYGRPALATGRGKPDPTRPVVTPGSDPAVEGQYDFWDHLDHCVDLAGSEGLYAILLPTWGDYVVGNYDGSDRSQVLFDEENAHAYGRFLGDRYKDRPHVVWMLGGDRAAVNGGRDSRPVFRALARGIADGVGEATGRRDPLMSYHPRKGGPQSSASFHDESWLDFNSIQEWPENQVRCVEGDWARPPAKPTWLFEGRYEGYHRNGYTPEQWGAWQVRQQAYQTVFAGAFGHTYGNERVFGFGRVGKLGPRDSPPAPGPWQARLRDPGALQVVYLARLMAALPADRYLDRIPDQGLIDGDAGKARRLASDRLTATRGGRGDYALVYAADGRDIRLRMDRLAGPSMDARWFDPRTGTWSMGGPVTGEPSPFAKGIRSGPGSPVHVFDPPGSAADGNDWVLVLDKR